MEPLIYPMLLHETCFLLASDFDKENWRDDAHTFLETLPSNEHSGSARAVTLGTRRGTWGFSLKMRLRRRWCVGSDPRSSVRAPRRTYVHGAYGARLAARATRRRSNTSRRPSKTSKSSACAVHLLFQRADRGLQTFFMAGRYPTATDFRRLIDGLPPLSDRAAHSFDEIRSVTPAISTGWGAPAS